MKADVAFGSIGVKRYLRPIKHHQQLWLVGVQPREQAIERDEAGASMEDAVEACAQFATAPRGGGGAIRLEVVVEAPDQRARALLRRAMQIGEGVQLMHQPFGMYPAQRVVANGELARVVTHNDHLAQQPVRLDTAPQRPFGCDTDWIRCDLHCVDAEAVEMSLPGSLIGEPCLSMRGQLMNDCPRQGAAAHIVQRRFVDDVVSMPGAQQIEKVQPALARPDFRHDVRPFASSLQIGNSGAPSDTAGIGITSSQADSVATILSTKYGFGAAGTWQAPTIPNPETNLFGKLDYELGVNSHLEVSGILVNANQVTLSHKFTSPFNGRDGYQLSNSGYNTQNQTRTLRGKWTATFANKYSNEAILGYTTISDNRNPESSLPLVLVHTTPATPNAYIAAGAERFSQNNILDQKAFELTDNLTFSMGEHLVTVGTHNEFFSFRNVFFPASFGVWNFGSIDSLNLGLANRYERALSTLGPLGPVADFSVKQFGFYAEDRFSPIRNLTVVAGLRMDVPSIPAPIENTSIDTVPLASLNGGVVHTSNSPTGNMLWSPRLGFNYDVNGDQQTILRGGIGIFSGRPPYVWVSNAFGNTGVGASTLVCTGQVGANRTPFFSPDSAYTQCGGGGLAASAAQSIVYYDPGFKFPQALKVALGGDRQLGWGILGTADFTYTKSINQYYLQDVNLQGVQTTAAGEGGRALYVQPTAFNAGTGSVSAVRLTSRMGQTIENVNKSADRATQLTLQLQKSFSNGIEFNAAYTYSHVQDLFSFTSDISGSNFVFGALDGTIANRNLRTSVYDRPHKISVSGTVNVPFDARFSLIYTGISGTPFTYVVANDVNGDGVGGNDPVYVPRDASDIEMKNGPADFQKLDAFINGEPCLRENRGRLLPRDVCRNPWQNQLSARLSKVFPTFGGQSVEVEMDMLNVLNFINSSWGLTRVTGAFEETNLIRLAGYDAAAGRGQYTLNLPVKNAVSINSLGSRWVFQLGARYTF